jgi:NADPH-dependent ferric siderophore reductase
VSLHRETVRHPLVVRRVRVLRADRVVPSIVRVTFGGDDLAGLRADGPDDHVKVFFPDPATGELHAPTIVHGALQRPTSGVSISRDYTPRALRSGLGGTELDVDFVLHGSDVGEDAVPGGPASAWATSASEGDEVVVAGPRGSRGMPVGVARVVLVADETALPAASRWLERLPAGIPVTAVLDLADEDVDPYTQGTSWDRASVERLYRVDGPGQLDEAVRSLGRPEADEYVWAAGEAGGLVPVRRYLRGELGLTSEQAKVEGYWKRGVTNRDHHAPLDPSDPD